MVRAVIALVVVLLLLSVSVAAQAQAVSSPPHLIRYTSSLAGPDGSPRTGVVGVLFSLYSDQQGGVAVWTELHNVVLDRDGHYAVLLGSQHVDGVPQELFTTSEARWLGLQVEAEAEQPRALLASVPYALKAGDADTLGGYTLRQILSGLAIPIAGSAEALAASAMTLDQPGRTTRSIAITSSSPGPRVLISVNATPAVIVEAYDDSTDTPLMLLLNPRGGNVGIGTDSPGQRLTVAGIIESTSGGFKFPDATLLASGIIGSSNLADKAVTQAKIGDAAIGGAQIATAAVGPSQIAAYAVISGKIAAGAVSSPEIAVGAVGSSQIAAGAVGSSQIAAAAVIAGKIASAAVGTSEIAAGAVGTVQLADKAVAQTKIADAAVGGGQIATGAVGSGQLAAGAVTSGKIAAAAVGNSEISAGAVGTAQLADKAVAQTKIADAAVGSSQIAVGAVGQSQLGDGAVTQVKIANAAVGQPQIALGAVGQPQIAAAAVGSGQLAAGAVGATQIAAAAVTTTQLADASVTAPKLNSMGCTSGQVLAWNGSVWVCSNGSGLTGVSAANVGGYFFVLPASSPNIIGGYTSNSVGVGVIGATISGGGTSIDPNQVLGYYGTVSGGRANIAGANGNYAATVGGGQGNTASAQNATIAGGTSNSASGLNATIGGGTSNTASGYVSTVAGGYINTASGDRSTVPGGSFNTAAGAVSFAAGSNAKAAFSGSFVWSDSSNATQDSAANQFVARATGGFYFYTNSNTTGAQLASGGNLTLSGGVTAGGIFGVAGGGNTVLVTSSGQLVAPSSSRRYKEDIHDMNDASHPLLRLRPVTFRYRKPFNDGSKPVQYGLIAEEVNEVLPQLVVHSPDGQVESVQYHLLPVLLLNEVQRQQRELDRLRQETDTLRRESERDRTARAELESRLSRLERMMTTTARAPF